ncbi:hypothetical protein A9Q81_11880 [Gammaproteobacteria bacterium 42_54_T18]|nr:hypothetical protein A9Q81_11880 [Gammaproteobacteria bacterium 42_54_T18]
MDLEQINTKIAALRPGETLRIEGFNEEMYHKSHGFGSTSLKKYIANPAKFKYGKPFEQKDCFDLGKTVHCLVLTPELFDGEFVTQPEEIKSRNSNAWKKYKEENSDKTILKAENMDDAKNMAKAVMASHSKFFTGGTPEVSYWKRHEIYTNIVLKARVDYDFPDLAIDLKTAASAEPEHFTKKAVDLGYHIQDILYRYVTGKREFAFVVTETEQPYCTIGPCTFDQMAQRLAQLTVEKGLADLSESIDMDYWPGYQVGSIAMGLAPWNIKKLTALEEGEC